MRAIHVLRKPLSESTVVANVLKHGCGGLNIDAARVRWASSADSESASATGFAKSRAAGRIAQSASMGRDSRDGSESYIPAGSGRWPANLVLQHLDGCVQTGVRGDSFNTAVPGTFGASIMDGRAGLGGLGSTPIYGHVSTTVAVYECAPGCPVSALDGQGDGASRFFKQVS